MKTLKAPRPSINNPAYRRTFHCLNAALEQTARRRLAEAGQLDYTGRIEELGRVMFGDDWDDDNRAPAAGPI